MADETNPDVSNDKLSSISSLNADAPSFGESNSSEHIEETQPRRLSTEENNNGDSHIQPIENGEHQQNPSNIQSVESTENHPIESQFLEETTSTDEQVTSSSHIESSYISDQQINDQDSFQINQNSFEQSNTFNNDNQSNTFNNDDQSNILHNQDDSNLLLVDHDISNIDTTFPTQTDTQDKPEELKAQRELDEDEIPPSELPVNETPIMNEINNAPPQSESNITDDRPLTELETPYEHHHENDLSPIEFSTSETNEIDHHPLAESEIPYENETNHLSLSSSLPDLVTETFEQNQDDFIPEPNQLEKPLTEQNLLNNELNFTEEDFPPLPPPSNPLEVTLNEKDFPPLPSASVVLEQILQREEERALLSSNNESDLPEPEDVLGNKTLFKQTIVKGLYNSHPTRSTMVTVSYTLSLVDNLTSNVRVIENVSNETFFVSECDIIPAIDICVQLMDRGERALIHSDIRHCYGEIGSEEKQIPPISQLNSYKMKIDLELHHWISPPDVQTLSIEERLHWGEKKRQMGNFYYRRQDYKTSLQCYRGALRFLDTDDNPLFISFDQSQRAILNDQYIQVQNNVAQVNLLLNKYQDCLIAVQNVLKYDPKNVKALFRQGKALYELGQYDQALQPLKLFNQIQKGNSNLGNDQEKVNEMIHISENKLANYQKSEKEIYRRMFQPTTTTTTNSTLNQQRQTKTNNQIDNANNDWWPYIALGSAVLAAIALATFIKYRRVS